VDKNIVIMEEILKYFPNLSTLQISQFEDLYDLYCEWNSKINVISRKDIENLYPHHVLHSLAIAKVIQFKVGTKILDIGTGGGFPGIPLTIMFPDCQFHLVDSIGKKITVVNEICKSLGLKNITTEVTRAELIKTKFHFIVSRAVTSLPIFLSWCDNKISKDNFNELKNGVLYLKGGDFYKELEVVKKWEFKIINIETFFVDNFFLGKGIVHFY